jgi:hypothetical protein
MERLPARFEIQRGNIFSQELTSQYLGVAPQAVLDLSLADLLSMRCWSRGFYALS